MKIDSESLYVLLPSLLVFLGFFGLVLLTFSKNKKQFPKINTLDFCLKILGVIILLLLILGSIFLLIYFIVFQLGWLLLFINSTIIIIGLAIAIISNLHKLFNKFKSLKLIILIIMYLPCLVIDIVDYIKYQFTITTPTVWLLLLLEIIFIILRILIPYLYKKYSNRNSNLILKGPEYLDKEIDLGYFQNPTLSNDPLIDVKKNANFNYNYAVSSWIWINPQSPSTSPAYNKSSSLINFGNIIKILFNKNRIEILASTSKEDEETIPTNKLVTIYKTKKILYQKWNNIIINYSGGTLDIFINNNLVVSKQNITPLLDYNKVTSGSPNGIHGGIKDIIYYDKVLSRSQIHAIYNSYI